MKCIPFEYEKIPLIKSGESDLTPTEMDYLLNGIPEEELRKGEQE